MLAVPYCGSEAHNPHSEAVASSEGQILVDLPDVRRKKKAKRVVPSQKADLFAQIESTQ